VTTLLERERELAELHALVGEVVAGRGCLVAMEAEAGLGKTRLLEAAREAGGRAGLRVLGARATELERDFPFALVRQLFGPAVTALPAPERDALFEGASAARSALGHEENGKREHDDFAVLHGLYWLTAALAERGPLLLAVDDAHWSDAASLDYLAFLLPRLDELPVLVVMTNRPDEPDLPVGLGRIVTDVSARRIALTALSCDAATELLTTELGHRPEPTFAATCHEVSGGNPFLLCELARTLVMREILPGKEQAEVVRELAPERVARTVLLRVARLGPEAGAVMRALAVLGDDSDHRLVAELAGLDPEATVHGADALRGSAILDPGPALRFIHPLVRNAIYADVPAGARGTAHARAASLLRDRDASPEQVATQLVATEPRGDRETVATLLGVGERALAAGAPRSAIAYLTRALREPPPADLRADVLGLLMAACNRVTDHSVLATIESDVLAELERNPSLRSHWAAQRTIWLVAMGRFEEAVPMLERGIEVAVAEDDIERAFQMEAQLSAIALLTSTMARGRLKRYVGQIDPHGPSGRLMAAMEIPSAVENGMVSKTVDAATRALGHDGSIFREEPGFFAPVAIVFALVVTDEQEAAERAAEQALASARDRGATQEVAGVWLLSALVAAARGDLSAAQADAGQAVELARLSGILPLLLLSTGPLVQILIERDELEAAEIQLEAIGVAAGPIPANGAFSLLMLARGHLRLEQGRFEQAAEDFVAYMAQIETMGIGIPMGAMGSPFAARALIATRRHEQAREMTESVFRDAKRWGTASAVALAMRARALVTGGSAGVELLREAAAVLEGSSRRLDRAQALSELGAALRRDGHRVEARTPLREALELARGCGAVRLARHTHAELRATGETVRHHTPIGVESLTPSERRVAELAASGMTNRQIAQSLFVTVKTVEAHLSASYDKLAIRSRQQLAAALSGPAG
jgi:DNA-binding CsgD family transcriptional regulator/tetratricopeptide (TPR) repeat protein